MACEGDAYRIDWRENGGPPIDIEVRDEGFGSRLMALSAERQLGGRIERNWHSQGLEVSLWIPSRSLSRVVAGTA